MNHFITMLNHSNNELPAISIIFTSRDFGHVIYIFICNMELRDPAASVKHKVRVNLFLLVKAPLTVETCFSVSV